MASVAVASVDRLAPRRRPHGVPVLHQRWHGVAFLHWPVAAAALRRIVPDGLEIDVHEGDAWVGITPFRVSRLRPTLLPPLPFLSSADEINVRVYVHRDGVPGIWFPSLEITNRLAILGARLAYRLPYFHARMRFERDGDAVAFTSERTGGAHASFAACWRVGAPLPVVEPGSLAFFLTERYVLYSGDAQRMLRARIHHRPWRLRQATVVRLATTLLEAARVPTPTTPVVAHAQLEPLDVAIWPPARCDRAR